MINLRIVIALAALASGLNAESVSGTILIKRKLTKPSVTASVSIYQRGTAVKLAKDGEDDPLAFENSRVAVWIEGPGPAADPDSRASMSAPDMAMQQAGRRFTPDLLVIPAGSSVSFPNMDPIFHNVFSLSKAKAFDLGNYPRGDSRTVVFPKAGIVSVNCHLHPNMAATIVVAPNRWAVRVDRSGHFELRDVPPGTYTVVAWHKAAGFFRKTVVVTAGHDAVTSFFIPLSAEGPEALSRIAVKD